MFLNDFIEDTLSLGAIQFATGIALDFLGEADASASVIQFLGDNVSENNRVGDFGGTREELEKILRNNKTSNILQSFIDFIWENPVLISTSKESRMQRVKAASSLANLVNCVSKKQIYVETMRILTKYPSVKLIYLFTSTNRFREVFSYTVRRNFVFSRDGVRKNDLSDGTISELLNDFSNWVWMYSSSGTYSLDSGTPIAFLVHTFKAMYQYSSKSNLYTILNTRGQNTELTEDQGTTALDMVGVADKRKPDSLDFVSICTKINRASYLLFSHASNKVAFYDIYSCYFDFISNSDSEKRRKMLKSLSGCSFSFVNDMQGAVLGHEGALANKKAGRVSICRLMERIITNGIKREDVFKLYTDILDRTSTLPVKDGARLFSTADYVTRHRENNSQMFQIIFDGYLAMKDLLDFLSTVDGDILESPMKFPVRIFRDATYLRRFRSFDEYIRYERYVENLCNEVGSDPERMVTSDDGIYNNDAVFNLLSAQKVVKSGIFARLNDMPLAYIVNAVTNVNVIDKGASLCADINRLGDFFICLQVPKEFTEEAYSGMGYVPSLRNLIQLGNLIYKQGKPTTVVLNDYPKYFAFCNCLKHVMELEKHPIADDNDNYLLYQDTVLQEFMYVKEFAASSESEQGAKLLNNSYTLRVIALHYVYQAFTGEDKFVGGKSTMTWEDLRNLFCINELLQSYVNHMYSYLRGIYFGDDSLFLTLSCAAQDVTLLEASNVIRDCDELAVLYSASTPQFRIFNHIKSEIAVNCNIRRNQKLVTAYNRLMVLLGDKLPVVEDLLEQIQLHVKTTGTNSLTVDVAVEGILREATHYLELNYTLEECDSSIRQQLETFSYDDLNLITIGARRACNCDRFYYHRRGYVIAIDRYSKTYTYHLMTEVDLNDVKALAFGG